MFLLVPLPPFVPCILRYRSQDIENINSYPDVSPSRERGAPACSNDWIGSGQHDPASDTRHRVAHPKMPIFMSHDVAEGQQLMDAGRIYFEDGALVAERVHLSDGASKQCCLAGFPTVRLVAV